MRRLETISAQQAVMIRNGNMNDWTRGMHSFARDFARHVRHIYFVYGIPDTDGNVRLYGSMTQPKRGGLEWSRIVNPYNHINMRIAARNRNV